MQIKKTIQLEKTDMANVKKIAQQALLQSATEAAAFGSEQAITLFELTTRQVAYVAAMTTKNGKTHGILRNPDGQCIAELIGSATVIAKALAKELDNREGVKPALNSKVSCEKDLADIMTAIRKSAMEAANLNIHASTIDVTDAYGNTIIRLAIINDSAGRIVMVNIVHENGEAVGGCTRTGNQENAPETLAVLAIKPLIRTARKKPEKQERRTIYAIMTFEKMEIEPTTQLPDMGDTRLVGWYAEKEDAIQAVKDNACDICECCYGYALIEAVREGLYQPADHDERWFFKYNSEIDSYDPIPEPTEQGWRQTVGYTIG